MGTIVVATDGSPAANAALDQAISLAQGMGDRIAVITVWRALQHDFGFNYPSAARLAELLEAERHHAESTLDDANVRVQAAGLEVETRLATGDPAELICAYADKLGARMIALGTHGYGTVVSLLVGSVSGEVIKLARRPVLVVHEPEGATAGEDAGHLVSRM